MESDVLSQEKERDGWNSFLSNPQKSYVFLCKYKKNTEGSFLEDIPVDAFIKVLYKVLVFQRC